MKRLSLLLVLLAALTGCEQLGIPDSAKEAAKKEAEGKAIGAACRQSGRALEDCFALNPAAVKSSVFTGWREMNDYMAENKLEVVKPEFVPGGLLPARRKAEKTESAETEAADETTEKTAASAPRASASARARARLAKSESH